MNDAHLDLAHRLVGELGQYAKAIDQYGNDRIAACMRNAASLLTLMIDEAELAKAQEALETAKARRDVDRSPSAVWRNATAEHDDG